MICWRRNDLEIIVAKTAGFCFGVEKAVKTAFDLVAGGEKNLYTFGHIIHNPQIVSELESRGVKVIEKINDLESPAKLIIRAHGVAPEVYEEIENKGIEMVDLTCPYVKKIHKLVKKKFEEGFQIIIIGDRNHPEVIGTNGWCNNKAYIVNDIEDVDRIPDKSAQTFVVAQTTIMYEKWKSITEHIEKTFKNVIKSDTICNATSKRQNESAEIASKVDMMIVIGGKNSSNTQKLYEISKKYCDETYIIESAGDLPLIDTNKVKTVGITAGASTPDWIIKEVIDRMEELNRQDSEVSFKEAFEDSLVTLESGKITKGRIIGFNDKEVYVDLGYKSDGVIPMEEYTDRRDFDPKKELRIGDEIEVYIVRVDDREGNVLLSKKYVDTRRNWNFLRKAFRNKTAVDVKVVEVIKGGLLADYEGINIFLPASQVSDKFVKDLSEYVGTTLTVRLIEFDARRKKVVASRKVLIEEENERKIKEFWDNIEVGKEYEGTVTSLTNFGAFVDLGGVEGLVHLTELSWSKIKHPSEVLKKGDIVTVRVLEFDRESGRISLGYKKAEDNPWYNIAEKYPKDSIVKGKVVRLVPFGAFVELETGVDGLVHISQISDRRIPKPDDVLSIGQEVEAKVLEVDAENNKIALSIKDVNPINPEPAEDVKKEKTARKEKSEKAKEPKERKKKSAPENEEAEETSNSHVEKMNVTLGDVFAGLGLNGINLADSEDGEN